MFYLHLKKTEYRFNHRMLTYTLICLNYFETTLFHFLSPLIKCVTLIKSIQHK